MLPDVKAVNYVLMDKDLKNKTLPELEILTEEFHQKKFLAGYIFSFIHTKDCGNSDEISSLSKPFRASLKADGYYISSLKVIEKLTDPDGTVKYLFELADGNRIESVVLSDDGRKTLCISTQAGCGLNCVFCATGKLGLKRNLTAAEIVDQVIQAQKDCGRIQNIVYMGMGEPFENYENVLKSIRILNHPLGKNIGARHITVSTAGVIPGIEKLAEEDLQVRLAISLNAPDNALRSRLMPINKKYPLEKLLNAIRSYQKKTRRRVTFEYMMIKDVNDSVVQAKTLSRLISGFKANINLIEYNPHCGADFKPSSHNTINRFKEILTAANIEAHVRFRRGQTIKAACGQLGADRINSTHDGLVTDKD